MSVNSERTGVPVSTAKLGPPTYSCLIGKDQFVGVPDLSPIYSVYFVGRIERSEFRHHLTFTR